MGPVALVPSLVWAAPPTSVTVWLVTVAQVLKAAGYATALIGKWGLGAPEGESEPTKKGFDYFFGYNCQRKAHEYYPEYLWRNREKVMLDANANGKQGAYSHDLMAADALEATAAGLMKMIPAGRFASAEDIAGGVAYLGSEDSAYVIGGELTVDGGLGQI